MRIRPNVVTAWLPAAAALALWLVLFSRLANEWTVNPQYQFGWSVPVLAAFLLWERWRDRPSSDGRSNAGRVAFVGAIVLALGWLPTRVILEAFPDWRPVLWAMALEAAGLSLLIMHATGGRAWARHFLFPILFILVSVPWPSPVENFAVRGLMTVNAQIAADTLTLFGHPAVQRGNLIEIGSGFIGVDEACSGMRSMQAALMIALLMGELFRFSASRRIAMAGAGLAIAFATNVGRSLYLVRKAVAEGVDAIAGVHDEAGWLTMAVCVAGLWFLGWLVRGKVRQEKARGLPGATGGGVPIRALPAIGALVLATVVAAEIATEAWFRVRGGDVPPRRPWSFHWPEGIDGFAQREVSDTVKQILGIDRGMAAAWSRADGSRWVVHFLRWEPQPLARAILAKYHSPEVCMPASGAALRDDVGRVDFDAGAGLPALAFHQYVFEEDGLPVHVFYLIVEDRSAASGRLPSSLVGERLRLVWSGDRTTGQTAVHVAVRGIESPRAAAAALARELPQWILPAAVEKLHAGD